MGLRERFHGAVGIGMALGQLAFAYTRHAFDHSWPASLVKGDTKRVQKYLAQNPSLANAPYLRDQDSTTKEYPLLNVVRWSSRNGGSPTTVGGLYHGAVNALLDAGARQDNIGDFDRPLLTLALGDPVLLKMLLENDASQINQVFGRYDEKMTTLGLAAEGAHVEDMRLLLSYGARQDLGKPPLEIVANTVYRDEIKQKMRALLAQDSAGRSAPKPPTHF